MKVLMILAAVCFLIAFLGQTSVVSGIGTLAFLFGGLALGALDLALDGHAPVIPIRRRGQ